MKIALGADHAGYALKSAVAHRLKELGHEVVDLGTDSEERADYPRFCAAVGREVAGGRADRGVVMGGSGQGEAIAANKSDSSDSLAPEFLILKGDLLLTRSSDNTAEAESLYQGALNQSREVRAAMVELQAAMRLSRLWQNRGEPERARELLTATYSKITEGFTTSDMKDAAAILDTLSS